jgi:hypothetical protein
MPSDIRSRTKPPGVTDPARATPAFFVGASFWDSFPDADPDARLYDRAPHPVQIGDSGAPGLMVDRRQIAVPEEALDVNSLRRSRRPILWRCGERGVSAGARVGHLG